MTVEGIHMTDREDSVRLDGKVAVVTGGSSGIGQYTALGLAKMGATVVIAARNADRLAETAGWLKAQAPGAIIEAEQVDFAALSSVRAMAARVAARHPRIAILVNNAGLVMGRRTVTEDGFEAIFQINHLAPFLLTNLLLPAIKADDTARIVNVASNASVRSVIDFDDLQLERGWGPMRVYGRSKLMNILFTFELARLLEGTGITANALHPGFVGTRIGNKGWAVDWLWALIKPFVLSSAQGAETPIFLASSPAVAGTSGQYFYKKKQIRANELAYDAVACKRLWQVSADLTGLDG
jgi:NAD(P)-dependent dehydrogenase (short-subunit alcohol dehydrogenase family)